MSETLHIQSVFHAGEIAVQTRLGVNEAVAPFGQKIIRDHMPDQHREFFENLPMMMIGAMDCTGRPWASAMFGAPGFMQSPDPKTLTLKGELLAASELGLDIGTGAKLGLLGIELSTRRRNRMNAVITGQLEKMMTLRVDQSFGNCPQYIQRRAFTGQTETAGEVHLFDGPALSAVATSLITKADTFFIASRTPDITDDVRQGADISHRGGRPGFVKISEDGTLCFPDFSGNRFFNTLGNISVDPRVGLFFPDFETGHALWITGRAEIIWDGPRVTEFKCAERLVEVTIDAGATATHILPLKGTFIDAWPLLQNTGVWAG